MPLVVVCGMVSSFFQTTVPPGLIIPLEGTKQSGSQPGIPEPGMLRIINSETEDSGVDSIILDPGYAGTVTDIGGGVIIESGTVIQLMYFQGIVYVPASTFSGRGTLQELLLENQYEESIPSVPPSPVSYTHLTLPTKA